MLFVGKGREGRGIVLFVEKGRETEFRRCVKVEVAVLDSPS